MGDEATILVEKKDADGQTSFPFVVRHPERAMAHSIDLFPQRVEELITGVAKTRN